MTIWWHLFTTKIDLFIKMSSNEVLRMRLKQAPLTALRDAWLVLDKWKSFPSSITFTRHTQIDPCRTSVIYKPILIRRCYTFFQCKKLWHFPHHILTHKYQWNRLQVIRSIKPIWQRQRTALLIGLCNSSRYWYLKTLWHFGINRVSNIH